jgi:phosphatidylglycerol:prolipoprotein diacylglycerol transferase
VSQIDWSLNRFAYTFFMAVSLVAFVLVRRYQPRSRTSHPQLSIEERFALAMAAFVGGMLSAKLPFLSLDANGWFSSQTWLTDGKTVTTGIAGAYAMVEITKWFMGIRVKTGDSFALPLAIALSIGRLGCFFNGCCYGLPTQMPWGVDFFGDGLRHPTQLYEVGFHLLMAVVLWHLAARDAFATHRLKFYLIAYCIFRFATEFLRPEPSLALGWTFYQWFSLVFASALALQWIASRTGSPPRD